VSSRKAGNDSFDLNILQNLNILRDAFEETFLTNMNSAT
jgi:hypothetical protein